MSRRCRDCTVSMDSSVGASGYQFQSRASLKINAMASWAEFEAAAPDFASRVRALMSSRKHLTMATLRRDGSPRISGTELEFARDQMKMGSMAGAVKAQDLFRDARVAIHGPTADPPQDNPDGWPGEAK